MEFKKGHCFTILGKRGSGKSFLARRLMQAYPRQVIFDPVNDWTDGETVYSFNQFADLIRKKINEGSNSFRIIFRFSPDDKNRPEILNEALRLIYYIGDIQAIIDEMQLFCTPHYMPEYLENLYFIGRHKDVGVTAITQRPSRLNKSCLSQSDHVFIGQLHEKNDLNVVADFLNKDSAEIINLKPRDFIYFSPIYGTHLFSTENKK